MELHNLIADITTFKALIFTMGLILVIVEMFHPGFGVPGIAGSILLISGIFLIAKSIMQVMFLILIIMIVLSIALYLVIKSAKGGRLSKTMILSHFQQKEAGYSATLDMESFLHKEGYTLTILRPSGVADFGGSKLDVVSEGGFIQANQRVKIIGVEGRRIVVREIQE